MCDAYDPKSNQCITQCDQKRDSTKHLLAYPDVGIVDAEVHVYSAESKSSSIAESIDQLDRPIPRSDQATTFLNIYTT